MKRLNNARWFWMLAVPGLAQGGTRIQPWLANLQSLPR
jgi:hypothetical protein